MSDIPYPPPPAPPIPQPPVARNSPVVSPGVANAVPPAVNPDDAFNQRLMSFGAAMAQSNSPSFFAQLGAGFGAVQNADRQDRREATQNREIDVMERYRMAQIAVEEAKLAAEQNPDSPQNQMYLARAESERIQARAALMRAGADAGGRPNFVAGEDDQGMVFFDPRTGQQVRPPTGMRAPGQMGREDAIRLRDQQADSALAQRLVAAQFDGQPIRPTQQEMLRAYEGYMQGIATQRERQRQPGGAAAPATPPANEPTIGLNGRPRTGP